MYLVKAKEMLLPDINGRELTITKERVFKHAELMLEYIERLLNNDDVIEITIRRCNNEETG